ncbi:MAG TPA: hypothetical protein PKG48_00195 [Bacteroidales bacterium]|nr:hypothetical protein [Bacteroidales bacterium]HPS62738.1 hypothetical protein [Bacteroidales bacterium]
MKAVFIVYNQSLSGQIGEILDTLMLRGFTQWTDITGNGSSKGMPHSGTHTWPELNHARMVVVADDRVTPLLDHLRDLDESVEEQGLRAFVWNVEAMI